MLVVNSGSSSLKYMLFSMKTETMLCKGIVERIGADNANLVYQPAGGEKQAKGVKALNHGQAFEHVCAALTNPKDGAVKSLAEIDAVELQSAMEDAVSDCGNLAEILEYADFRIHEFFCRFRRELRHDP